MDMLLLSPSREVEHEHALARAHGIIMCTCFMTASRRLVPSHLCTRGDPTVALSNHPSSVSVGNTRPLVEVYSPSGEDAMSGVLLHPREAARPGVTFATNANAGVHDARAITAAEGASMINTQHRKGGSTVIWQQCCGGGGACARDLGGGGPAEGGTPLSSPLLTPRL